MTTNAEFAAETTIRDGGGTFTTSTLRMTLRASGYAVAISHNDDARNVRIGDVDAFIADHPMHDRAAVADTFGRANVANVAEKIMTVARTFADAPFIGTWMDGGRVYVDPVVILPDRASAVIVAQAFAQRAIYNFATQTAEDI